MNLVEILKNVRDALSDQLTYIGDRDVFLTDDLGWIPPEAQSPCIGIKDGKTNSKDVIGGEEHIHRIEMVVHVHNTRGVCCGIMGDGIMGDGNKKGVLEICDDIDLILKDNRFDQTIQLAWRESMGGSKSYGEPDDYITSKPVVFAYMVEEV